MPFYMLKNIQGINISEDISPHDKMLDQNRSHYFSVSQDALKCIIIALHMANKQPEEINQILDFPCGHGRVLRALRAYWPNTKITACDLDQDGVDYCVKTFGAIGVYPKINFKEISLQKTYDLIWCGSLITHLKEDKAKEALDFLIEQLNEDGILVITMHGRICKHLYEQGVTNYDLNPETFSNVLEEYNSHSFGYSNYEGQNEYGVSIQKLCWASNYIQSREDITLIYQAERLWDMHQDVLTIQKTSLLNTILKRKRGK